MPFARGESMAVLWAHMYEPPPSVYSRRRDLPAAVDDVLARALAKAPGERYATCGEFTGALRDALGRNAAVAAAPPATMAEGPAAFVPTLAAVPPDEPTPRPVTAAAATLAPTPPLAPPERPTAGRPPAESTYRPAAAPSPLEPRLQPLPRDGRGPEPFLQRWLFSTRLVYVLAGALVLAGLAGGGWWLASGRYTSVPTVSKLTAQAAAQALRQAGFQVRTASSVIDDNVPKGEVISTSPSGRALPGATIALTLSRGPRIISVPPIPPGDSVDQAKAVLRKAGLTVAAATQPVGVPSDPRIGAVAGTTPAAGRSWPENKPVSVNVVAGLTLPNLVGQNIDTIQAWAAQNHLTIQSAQVSSDQPKGTIEAQSPSPGPPGQTVSVSVSNGPPMISTPSVQGESCQAAQQVLQQAGFQVQVQQGSFQRTVASGTSPTGRAPSGAIITLRCGSSNPF